MKYLKNFEMSIDIVQKGDYVILYMDENYQNVYGLDYVNFINTHIGKIISKNIELYYVTIEYSENVPGDGSDNIIRMSTNIIKHKSQNKEELEMILQSNKYNL